jgi:hypothetical protein
MSGNGPGILLATLAGVRNIPEPIVDPTTIARALQKPMLRGSAPGSRAGGVVMAGNATPRERQARGTHAARHFVARVACCQRLASSAFSHAAIVKALIFWSAAALLIFGELMILRAWWAGRTPAAGTRRPRASEFAFIALPVIALSVMLALTWRAQRIRSLPNQGANEHAGHAS